MKLEKLLRNVPVTACTAARELEITGVCYDSRQVRPGDLFVAVPGFAADGHRFIPMALEKGAAAVLALPLMLCRWKKDVRLPALVGYGAYPAHLALLWVLEQLV